MIFHSLFLCLFLSVFIIIITYHFHISPSKYSLLQINTRKSQFIKTNTNLTKALHRRKRFLIFQDAGVLKMVLGFSEPIHFFDEVPFRQLAVNYAFHLQYSPPIVPVYWWTYFYKSTAWSHIHGRTIHDRHKKSTCNAKYICNENPYLDLYWNFAHRNYGQLEFFYDKSRLALYKAIETILECRGFPGKACLIRSICEVSRRPFYERNSLPRILNAIFIPLTKNTDHKFVHAKHLGSHGLICKKIYWNCEDGVKWLQKL